eukprot:scaffold12662_cov171-Skeletonema_marinoi.AAC.2
MSIIHCQWSRSSKKKPAVIRLKTLSRNLELVFQLHSQLVTGEVASRRSNAPTKSLSASLSGSRFSNVKDST